MLLSLPEELIERVLYDVFSPSLSVTERAPRGSQTSPSAPLLTCKCIYRVGAPLFYRTITLHSPQQLALLLSTFESSQEMSSCVRSIVLEGVWKEGLEDLFRLCSGLRALDLTLDDGWEARQWTGQNLARNGVRRWRETNTSEVLGFCDALKFIRNLRSLTIRKDSATYITLGPVTILQHIGKHVGRWTELEHVEIAFKYTDLHASVAKSALASEIVEQPPPSLPAALAQSPNLRTITTLMPAIWNDALLEISANPSLKHIQFVSSPSTPGTLPSLQAILPSALYYRAASNHPRLIKLINAGSQVLTFEAIHNSGSMVSGRARAKTVGYVHSKQDPNQGSTKGDESRDVGALHVECQINKENAGGIIAMRRSSAI